jgi:outer membrane protein assembly factor BamB
MKRLAYPLAAAILAAAGSVTLTAQQPVRAKLYSQPTPPPRDLLDRLNMQMSFRTYVPMDGRQDGLVTVQLRGRNLFVQTRSGLVTLIDAETGAALWRQRVGRSYVAEHALAFNSREVYVVNNVHLYALDRLSGAVNWSYRLPEGVAAAPVADETMIFIPSQTGRLTAYLLPRPDLLATATGPANPKESREERYKRIVSLRSDTGGTSSTVSHLTQSASEASTAEDEAGPHPIRIWSDVTSLRLELPIVMTPDRLVIPTPNGIVAALAKAPSPTGQAVRSYRFTTTITDGDPAPIRVPAGYFDGVVYVGGEDANLYALEAAGGRPMWRYTVGVPISRRPIALERDVFVVAEKQGMTMLDRTTGAPKWRIPVRGGPLAESNAAANYFLAANPKYVYAFDSSGHFLVLDRRRGVTLSGFDTRDFVYPISNEVTDRVYLAANNGLIVCLHDREYPKPLRHRQREEELENPVRIRLSELVSLPATPPMALRDMLLSWSQRFPPLRFRIEERLFREAGRESPAGENVKMLDVKDKPLGEVIKGVLATINCTYDFAGDLILIVPAPPAPPPAPVPAPK